MLSIVNRFIISVKSFWYALKVRIRLVTLEQVVSWFFDILMYITVRVPASEFVYQSIEDPWLAFFLDLIVRFFIIWLSRIVFNRLFKDWTYKVFLQVYYLVTCVRIRFEDMFTVVLYKGYNCTSIYNEFRFMPRPNPAAIQDLISRHRFLDQQIWKLNGDVGIMKAIHPALLRDKQLAFAESFLSSANRWEKELTKLAAENRELNQLRHFTQFFKE